MWTSKLGHRHTAGGGNGGGGPGGNGGSGASNPSNALVGDRNEKKKLAPVSITLVSFAVSRKAYTKVSGSASFDIRALDASHRPLPSKPYA